MSGVTEIIPQEVVSYPVIRRFTPSPIRIEEGAAEENLMKKEEIKKVNAAKESNSSDFGCYTTQTYGGAPVPAVSQGDYFFQPNIFQLQNCSYNLPSYVLQYNQPIQIQPALIIDSNSINNIYINPHMLGFLPREIAEDKQFVLSDIIKSYFQIRSTKKVRFEHKLWNALCITKMNPILFRIIGVMWISDNILKVHRSIFANLLGITKPTAALFNIQGSFPSHGFIEVDVKDASKEVSPQQLTDVDGIQIRLFQHEHHLFTSHSGIDELVNCRWKENFAA